MVGKLAVFKRSLVTVFILSLILPAYRVYGQNYPTKPIALIVCYGPGGRQDTVARIIADKLDQYLKQRIVVVNKAGGGGVLGEKELTSSKPDGYTIGIFSSGTVVLQYTVTTPTDLKDYDPICLVSEDPAVLAVSMKSGWKNINDLIKYAQKNPGEVKMGITPGAASHLSAAAFADAAHIKVTYVPFKGGGDKIVAVAGGHVDACTDVLGPFKSLADAGKIRLLGIAASERTHLNKEVPTMKEQGLDFVMGTFIGIAGPKGLPPKIIDTLEKALEKTTQDKEVKERMDRIEMELRFLNRSNFLKMVEREDKMTKKLVQDLGLYVAPAK